MKIYLFVLCPPYSGSTVLWKLLATSPNVSTLPTEGQFLQGVQEIVREDLRNLDKRLPWGIIKSKWEEAWDLSKPILLEKSPPNLIRAFEIEKHFVPSYFIAMVRNPYALCEGLSRRNGVPIKVAARSVVKYMEYQISNIQGLNRIMYFTYAELTENPSAVAKRMLEFMPELQLIDITGSFSVHSIFGYGARKITNLNRIKINQLSGKDILEINDVLKDYPHLMRFFGYEYIYPTIGHAIRHYQSVAWLKGISVLQRARHLSKRVLRS